MDFDSFFSTKFIYIIGFAVLFFFFYRRFKSLKTLDFVTSSNISFVLKEDPLLLDVRTIFEHQTFHPKGAIHIELKDLPEAKLDPERHYIVFCASGIRASKGVSILNDRDFGHVWCYTGTAKKLAEDIRLYRERESSGSGT